MSHVGLADIDDPPLPLVPPLIEAREAAEAVVAKHQLGRARRSSGACGEHCDDQFSARIRRVDRGQIGDNEGEQRDTDRGLREGDHVRGEPSRADKAERQQRRPARLECRADAALGYSPEDTGVPDERQNEPHARERNQPHRRPTRHDSVAANPVGRCAPQPDDAVEDPAHRGVDKAVQHERHRSRNNERLDRLPDCRGDERHPGQRDHDAYCDHRGQPGGPASEEQLPTSHPRSSTPRKGSRFFASSEITLVRALRAGRALRWALRMNAG
jgi:hypothetical protein